MIYAHWFFMCRSLQATIPGLLIILLLPGCETTKPEVDQAVAAARVARQQAILTEETGDYYIGRRYHVEPTRYWGYLRRPRSGWETAKLVMMNESIKPVPDSRLGREEKEVPRGCSPPRGSCRDGGV